MYSLSFTSDRSVIQDVVQDAFMYLWSNRKKIVITTSIKSYMYKMVYNLLMDVYRNNTKEDTKLLSYYKTFLNEAIESEDNYKEELLKKLDDCIAGLPKRCKEVFWHKKIKGYKSKQIASNLGISIKTVEAHITKAYIFLRKCLNPESNSVL